MKTWFWNEAHSDWEEKNLPTQKSIDNPGLFHYNGGLWCFSERKPY